MVKISINVQYFIDKINEPLISFDLDNWKVMLSDARLYTNWKWTTRGCDFGYFLGVSVAYFYPDSGVYDENYL